MQEHVHGPARCVRNCRLLQASGTELSRNRRCHRALRRLTRRVGVVQNQAKPVDTDALAAIRATAVAPRTTRDGSLEVEETALKCGRLDTALAWAFSDAVPCISHGIALRCGDVHNPENEAKLILFDRSKTYRTRLGVCVGITPDTVVVLKQLWQDTLCTILVARDCSP